MRSLRGAGLGLSVVFGCLVLALVGELYYLLWWKKRSANRSIEEGHCLFCLKKPSQLVSQSSLTQEEAHNPDPEMNASGNLQSLQSNEFGDGNGKDLFSKPIEQETMETELMRLHKLSGPPRFLFTIVEETREDLLDLEDGRSLKGSRGKSLSDLLIALETPYHTPIASPSLFTPPLTPIESAYTYSQHGFNPLFESTSDAEFNRVRASPPPKFKFLQDAEEKLRMKIMAGEIQRTGGSHDRDFSISQS